MNYSSLQNLLPSYFKIIGYILALLTLTISILIRFDINFLPESITLRIIQSIFLISFILMLASKSKTEDERISTIRLAISSYGFYSLIVFLIIWEIIGILIEYTFILHDAYNGILCFIILLVIGYEILSRTSLIDFIEQNKKDLRYYRPIIFIPVVFIFLTLMRVNSWL